MSAVVMGSFLFVCFQIIGIGVEDLQVPLFLNCEFLVVVTHNLTFPFEDSVGLYVAGIEAPNFIFIIDI